MSLSRPVRYDLGDCRPAHGRTYETEIHDGDTWVSHGQLVVMRDMVVHDGDQLDVVDYHGATHALTLRGKADQPDFHARLNLTEGAEAFVGTVSVGGGPPQALRGVALEQTYHTQRSRQDPPSAPFEPWVDLTIRSEWVDHQLKITYLLGDDDISDRTRVSKVDRATGQTWLDMVPEFEPPFLQNAFSIILASGNQSFGGTLTDEDGTGYDWRGGTAVEVVQRRAAVLREARRGCSSAPVGGRAAATKSLQDLDNISSIQVLIDEKGEPRVVDFAQTTCGGYYNKCLVNALDSKWIDGIYGHSYSLPPGVQKVLANSSDYFTNYSVLGTGQMLYDTLGTSQQYKDLIKRIDAPAMDAAWKAMGGTTTQEGKPDSLALEYQEASNALYIQGYRDGVAQMQPYLADDPEAWAERYFNWLSDSANLLTWQIQVASHQFDNVKTRMYEWYVKLQVLAPDKDYGKRFTTIAYAALLGVNYSRSQWAADLKPFLDAVIANAVAGKVDPSVMDDVQRQAAKENQELLAQLVSTSDQITLLVDAISNALTAAKLKKSLQQIAQDPEAQALIGRQLQGAQYEAWSSLTTKGKIGGLLSTLFYGASAGYLIYTIVQDSKNPQTPKQVASEVNMGVLALAILVKGVEKMMSLGVGRFLESFSQAGQGGAFRAFAGDLAMWFKEGGKIVPEGPVGKAFVAIFGESSAEFMARRIGPAMAVCGLVLAAFTLYSAIKSGDVRNIVFEALNTFIALASVVLIGLELMSFAWAGPVGLAVAAIGIVIVLVQFIWNMIDPPEPPPDPITEFVNGPMVSRHFARAS